MAKKWVRVGRWQDGMRGTHNYQAGLRVTNGDRTVNVTGDCAESEDQYNKLYKGEEIELPILDAMLAHWDSQ